jgi:hypothetical protein
MGFVEDDRVPVDVGDFVRLRCRKLIRGDDNMVGDIERQKFARFARVLIALALNNGGRERELFGKLLAPLLAQACRDNQKNAPFAFGPSLRDYKARLDRFAEADFVGEDDTFRKRRRQGEEGGVDLMGVHIDARRRKGLRERVVAHTFEGDLMRKERTLVWRNSAHRVF